MACLLVWGMRNGARSTAVWCSPASQYTERRTGEQRSALLDTLRQAAGDVVLVSNEVGMGITPLGAVSRCFVDEAGRLKGQHGSSV